MITEIKTLSDLQKLPSGLQHAMRGPNQNTPDTPRHRVNINAAENKLILQNAVVAAVKAGDISYDLGLQILQARNAYGAKGKAAMKQIAQEF